LIFPDDPVRLASDRFTQYRKQNRYREDSRRSTWCAIRYGFT
jgi:hypothetical protein